MPERKANPSKPSTVVLFQRSGAVPQEAPNTSSTSMNSMWDDSELIAAWNRQLDRSKALEADPTPLVPRANDESSDEEDDDDEQEEEEEESGAEGDGSSDNGNMKKNGGRRASAADDQKFMMMPPIPPGTSARLASMLQSWFAAGLQTGMYLAAEEAERTAQRKRPRSGGDADS